MFCKPSLFLLVFLGNLCTSAKLGPESTKKSVKEVNYVDEMSDEVGSPMFGGSGTDFNDTVNFLLNILSDRACRSGEEERILECTMSFGNLSSLTNLSNGDPMGLLLFQNANFTELSIQIRAAIKESCDAYSGFETCANDVISGTKCRPISYRVITGVHSVICGPGFLEALVEEGPCYANVSQTINVTEACGNTYVKSNLTSSEELELQGQDFRDTMCEATFSAFNCMRKELEPKCGSKLIGYVEKITLKALGAVFGERICNDYVKSSSMSFEV